MVKAIRVADRHDELARSKCSRVAKGNRHEVRCRDSQYGHIGIGILTDDVGIIIAPIRQRDLQL